MIEHHPGHPRRKAQGHQFTVDPDPVARTDFLTDICRLSVNRDTPGDDPIFDLTAGADAGRGQNLVQPLRRIVSGFLGPFALLAFGWRQKLGAGQRIAAGRAGKTGRGAQLASPPVATTAAEIGQADCRRVALGLTPAIELALGTDSPIAFVIRPAATAPRPLPLRLIPVGTGSSRTATRARSTAGGTQAATGISGVTRISTGLARLSPERTALRFLGGRQDP